MFYRILNKSIEVVTILFLSCMIVLVPTEVLLRYAFGKSLYVTEELTRYLMVWMVFLGSSLAFRENSHITIEILVNRFHGRSRSWWNLIAQVLLLTFLIFIIIEGIIPLTFQMRQIVPSLGVPMFWFYLAIPVGGVVMILNILPKIWESLKIVLGRSKPGQRDENIPQKEQEGGVGGTV